MGFIIHHRIKPKKPLYKKLWFWFFLLFLTLSSTVVYFLFFCPNFQVKNIEIFGNTEVSSEDLYDTLMQCSHTGLMNLWNIKLASDSIFLVDANDVASQVLNKFPEIEIALLTKKFPQTLIINVKEREPIGTFCDPVSQKCFLIDKKGIAFQVQDKSALSGTIVRQTELDFTASVVDLGKAAILEQNAENIYKIQNFLKEQFDIVIKDFNIRSAMRLDARTSQGWHVYFLRGDDDVINLQLEKIGILLEREIAPERRANLRYIDLRPKDRAIICDNQACAD